MILSSNETIKQFFWKYIDYNMNTIEIETFKNRIIINKQFKQLFNEYNSIFCDENDMHNYVILFSCIDHKSIDKFILFFQIHLKHLGLVYEIKKKKNSLSDIIDNKEKMKICVLCFHFYF
jgi:hypothetical protein